MIYYKINDVKTHVTVEVRKDASVNVDINVGSTMPTLERVNVIVTAHLNSLEAQVALSHAMEALRHQWPRGEFILDLPYTPYARQDRRCNPGEAFGIKVFGDYINRMDFKAVILTDPHSDVTAACIDRAEIMDQESVFGRQHDFGAGWYIVAPDMGAKKKAEAFAKATGAKGVITCYKERNMYTGEIVSQGVIGGENIPKGARFFVLDDICDGGRTFVGVAELLKQFEPSALELAVTHGIFSYGTDVVTDVYDHVYTTNSFNPLAGLNDKITVLEID